MIGTDTTFIIDLLQGEQAAVKAMNMHETICMCEPVLFEFLCGDIKEYVQAEVLLLARTIDHFSMNTQASQHAAHVFRHMKEQGKTIGKIDAMIAGIYLANGVNQIITRNAKHFEGIPGLKVISY